MTRIIHVSRPTRNVVVHGNSQDARITRIQMEGHDGPVGNYAAIMSAEQARLLKTWKND